MANAGACVCTEKDEEGTRRDEMLRLFHDVHFAVDALQNAHLGRETLSGFSYFTSAQLQTGKVGRRVLSRALDPLEDRAVGCLLGLAIGDSLGAPLEFSPVRYGDTSYTGFDDAAVWSGSSSADSPSHGQNAFNHRRNAFQLKPGQWTDDTAMALCFADSLIAAGLGWTHRYRQATTNTSSDHHNEARDRGGASASGSHSLISHTSAETNTNPPEDYEPIDRFDPVDLRLRFCLWWALGYNNAFGLDEDRLAGKSSVGLGGNISLSLGEFVRSPLKGGGFTGEGTSETSGNGSLMRLAPAALRWWGDLDTAMRAAAWGSRTTHRGDEASDCCRLLAFILVRAFQMREGGGDETPGEALESSGRARSASSCPSPPQSAPNSARGGGAAAGCSSLLVRRLLGDLSQFRAKTSGVAALASSEQEYERVAAGRLKKARRAEEAKKETEEEKDTAEDGFLPVSLEMLEGSGDGIGGIGAEGEGEEAEETEVLLEDRDWRWRAPSFEYCKKRAEANPGYVGSYAMDALAMALHCVWTTANFKDAVLKAASLRGDSDTVAAICGQIAGALYGCAQIPEDWLRLVFRWDGGGSIASRALALVRMGAPRASFPFSPFFHGDGSEDGDTDGEGDSSGPGPASSGFPPPPSGDRKGQGGGGQDGDRNRDGKGSGSEGGGRDAFGGAADAHGTGGGIQGSMCPVHSHTCALPQHDYAVSALTMDLHHPQQELHSTHPVACQQQGSGAPPFNVQIEQQPSGASRRLRLFGRPFAHGGGQRPLPLRPVPPAPSCPLFLVRRPHSKQPLSPSPPPPPPAPSCMLPPAPSIHPPNAQSHTSSGLGLQIPPHAHAHPGRPLGLPPSSFSPRGMTGTVDAQIRLSGPSQSAATSSSRLHREPVSVSVSPDCSHCPPRVPPWPRPCQSDSFLQNAAPCQSSEYPHQNNATTPTPRESPWHPSGPSQALHTTRFPPPAFPPPQVSPRCSFPPMQSCQIAPPQVPHEAGLATALNRTVPPPPTGAWRRPFPVPVPSLRQVPTPPVGIFDALRASGPDLDSEKSLSAAPKVPFPTPVPSLRPVFTPPMHEIDSPFNEEKTGLPGAASGGEEFSLNSSTASSSASPAAFLFPPPRFDDSRETEQAIERLSEQETSGKGQEEIRDRGKQQGSVSSSLSPSLSLSLSPSVSPSPFPSPTGTPSAPPQQQQQQRPPSPADKPDEPPVEGDEEDVDASPFSRDFHETSSAGVCSESPPPSQGLSFEMRQEEERERESVDDESNDRPLIHTSENTSQRRRPDPGKCHSGLSSLSASVSLMNSGKSSNGEREKSTSPSEGGSRNRCSTRMVMNKGGSRKDSKGRHLQGILTPQAAEKKQNFSGPDPIIETNPRDASESSDHAPSAVPSRPRSSTESSCLTPPSCRSAVPSKGRSLEDSSCVPPQTVRPYWRPQTSLSRASSATVQHPRPRGAKTPAVSRPTPPLAGRSKPMKPAEMSDASVSLSASASVLTMPNPELDTRATLQGVSCLQEGGEGLQTFPQHRGECDLGDDTEESLTLMLERDDLTDRCTRVEFADLCTSLAAMEEEEDEHAHTPLLFLLASEAIQAAELEVDSSCFSPAVRTHLRTPSDALSSPPPCQTKAEGEDDLGLADDFLPLGDEAVCLSSDQIPRGSNHRPSRLSRDSEGGCDTPLLGPKNPPEGLQTANRNHKRETSSVVSQEQEEKGKEEKGEKEMETPPTEDRLPPLSSAPLPARRSLPFSRSNSVSTSTPAFPQYPQSESLFPCKEDQGDGRDKDSYALPCCLPLPHDSDSDTLPIGVPGLRERRPVPVPAEKSESTDDPANLCSSSAPSASSSSFWASLFGRAR